MQFLNLILSKYVFVFLAFGSLFLSNCSGSASADSPSISVLDKAKEAATMTTNTAKSMAEDVKDMSSEAINEVAESAEEATDKMVDTAKDGIETIMDGGKATIEKAKEDAKATVDMAKGGAKASADVAKDAIQKTDNSIENRLNKTKDVEEKRKEIETTSTTQASKKVIKTASTKASKVSPNNDTVKEVQTKTEPTSAKPAPVGVSHEVFDNLLKKHVSSSGVVDYAGFKSDIGKLDAYLEQLEQNPTNKNVSRDKQLAYWINAYNAFTIKLILNNFPVGSITDLNGGKPWDKKWIKIGDNTYSLNNIENDIIRPQFKEPRIHFAVNCAAQSCPPLLNRAWTAANLEKYFTSQTRSFVNNPKYNKIDGSSAQLSKIFEWYGEDFGDLKTFINKYSEKSISAKSNITFMDYDWKLNGK